MIAVRSARIGILHGNWPIVPNGDSSNSGFGGIYARSFKVGVVLNGQLQAMAWFVSRWVSLDGRAWDSTRGGRRQIFLIHAGTSVSISFNVRMRRSAGHVTC